MSKNSKRPGPTPRGDREPNARSAGTAGSNPPVEETLVDIAEDLGKLLGTAQNRMSSWLGERQQIATQLVQIRDTANAYLRELTAGGATLAAAVERGTARGSGRIEEGSVDVHHATREDDATETPREALSAFSVRKFARKGPRDVIHEKMCSRTHRGPVCWRSG